MKKKITIVDKDLNQLVVVADCSSALYQDRGTKLGEQNLLSDTAVTFKVYDGTVQVAVMMADILQVPTNDGGYLAYSCQSASRQAACYQLSLCPKC